MKSFDELSNQNDFQHFFKIFILEPHHFSPEKKNKTKKKTFSYIAQ